MTDAFAQLARLQRAKAANPEIVDVPEPGFLMIEGDAAGAAPERLRTILRHPVAER
jgi:hypothetical protein